MRIIYPFKDKEELDLVLYKLKEYEGIKYKTSNGKIWKYGTDLYLRTNLNGFGNKNISNLDFTKAISAYDYLNPIKVGDRVEVTDNYVAHRGRKGTVININNKPMNIIETEVNDIANAAYFNKPLNIKVIHKSNEQLSDYIKLIDEVRSALGEKFVKLNGLNEELNSAYERIDSDKVKEVLSKIAQVTEYMKTYIKNPIKDLGSEKEETTFDVKEFFN